MFPFRKKPKPAKHLKKMVVGFIIGAAITSIIGKKMLEKDEGIDDEEGDDRD